MIQSFIEISILFSILHFMNMLFRLNDKLALNFQEEGKLDKC
jgi:hypothetical protein